MTSILVPGTKLDRYQLLCPLAAGGMAEVWVARLVGRHGFEKRVAIKTIRSDHTSENRYRTMFLDEARVVSSIRHPNVAEILDLGEHQGVLYAVHEWIEGESLSYLFKALDGRGERFPLGIALGIASDMAAGLHAAHEARDDAGKPREIVHRDVSLSNVMVGLNGAVKVIDFGIAMTTARLAEETESGQIKGKISYLAPEQAFGRSVDRRTDVWAIGVVLYQLLSGRLPFRGESQWATFHMLAERMPPPPLLHVPDSVVEIVRDTLKHDRNERISTAAELHERLKNALRDEGRSGATSDIAAFIEPLVSERAARRRTRIDEAIANVNGQSAIMAKAEQTSDVSAARLQDGTSVGGLLSKAATPPLTPLEPEQTGTLGSSIMDHAPGRRRRKRALLLAAGVAGAICVAGAGIALRGANAPAAETTSRALAESPPPAEQKAQQSPGISVRPQAQSTAPPIAVALPDSGATGSLPSTKLAGSPPPAASNPVSSPKTKPKPAASSAAKKTVVDVFQDRF